MALMDSIRENSDLSDNDFILSVIRSLFIIDLGIISYIYSRSPNDADMRNGIYADVTLGDNSTVTNVEILALGNQGVNIDLSPSPGCRVLMFGLKHSFSSIEDMFPTLSMQYSGANVKGIPIGHMKSRICSLLLDGGLFFSGPDNKFGMSANGSMIKKGGDGAVNDMENPDGSYTKSLGGRSFEVRNKVDGGYVNEWTLFDKAASSDRKILYKRVFNDIDASLSTYEREITDIKISTADKEWGRETHRNPDGSCTEVIKDPDGKVLFSREFYEDGSIHYMLHEQNKNGEDFLVLFSQYKDGSFSRLQTSDGLTPVNKIVVGKDGTTSIDVGDGKYILEITPNGKSSILCETEYSVEAPKITAKATNPVEISGGNIYLNSGALGPYLKQEGTAAQSLGSAATGAVGGAAVLEGMGGTGMSALVAGIIAFANSLKAADDSTGQNLDKSVK